MRPMNDPLERQQPRPFDDRSLSTAEKKAQNNKYFYSPSLSNPLQQQQQTNFNNDNKPSLNFSLSQQKAQPAPPPAPSSIISPFSVITNNNISPQVNRIISKNVKVDYGTAQKGLIQIAPQKSPSIKIEVHRPPATNIVMSTKSSTNITTSENITTSDNVTTSENITTSGINIVSTPISGSSDITRTKSNPPSRSISSSQKIKVEHANVVTRSSSGDVRAPPSSKSDPLTKIKIERKDSSSEKLSISASADGELCPFCGIVSLQFHDLMIHILGAHKLTDTLWEMFRADKNPGKCSKCNESIDDTQFANHCVTAHESAVLEMIRDHCMDLFKLRSPDIEAFIEKHAPQLNPRFKRTFEISSSSDSNDDDDDEDSNFLNAIPIDEEYTSFIASSIHANGLAAKSTVKPIESMFDPQKIATKHDVDSNSKTSSAEEYINRLADYEVFLRSNGLVSYSEVNSLFSCKFCKKKFDSMVRMVDHSHQQHKLRITPEIRRALCVMNNSIQMDTEESELMKIPGINLGLTLYPLIKASDVQPTIAMDVPQIFVDFLLETLSVSQPVVNPYHTPKIFCQPTTVMLRLPTPLPVIFSPSKKANFVQLGYVDTAIIDARSIRTIVSETLNSLAKTVIYDAKFSKMDKECGFTDDQLMELSEKLKIDILKTEDVFSEDDETTTTTTSLASSSASTTVTTSTRSFSLLLLVPKWSDATMDDINYELRTLFDEADICVCKKCREPFNLRTGGHCEGPRASGLTIKVKGGVHEAEYEVSGCTCDILSLKEWQPK